GGRVLPRLRCRPIRADAARRGTTGGRGRAPHHRAGGSSMIGMLLLLAAPGSAPETPANAPSESELIAKAEAAYREGLAAHDDIAKARPRFRASAEAWEALWRMGRRNAAVARNMAQSHLLGENLAG